jgi:hypothetical protein
MNEFSLAPLLGHPLGQLAVTAIVAAVTAVVTVRIMDAFGAGKGTRRVAGPASAPRADPAIVAAISAAVYTAIGAHRIVYLAEARRGSSWTTEMRAQHHTSHAPHH